MLLGLTGEVGELVDVFKRCLIYNQELDIDNALEELGDLEFYLAGLRNGLLMCGGQTRDQILEQNVAKLSTRYPDGYSNKAAADRADKVLDTAPENAEDSDSAVKWEAAPQCSISQTS
jgi:NTP pyrophosphatase (non-canonical NTP hydrolase)